MNPTSVMPFWSHVCIFILHTQEVKTFNLMVQEFILWIIHARHIQSPQAYELNAEGVLVVELIHFVEMNPDITVPVEEITMCILEREHFSIGLWLFHIPRVEPPYLLVSCYKDLTSGSASLNCHLVFSISTLYSLSNACFFCESGIMKNFFF